MFCPNCGQEINFKQSYCRACGMGISEMLQRLSEYSSDSVEKVDWLKRIGLFSMGIIFAVMLSLGIIIYGNAYRLPPITIFVFMTIFSSILMGTASVLYFQKGKSEKIKLKEIEGKNYVKPEFESWSTNRELNESKFAPIGSVTDHTTELFTSKIPRTRTSGDLG